MLGSDKILKTIADVGRAIYPAPIAASRDGARVYVGAAKMISVIDGQRHTKLATIKLEKNPTALALSPDGLSLYVTDRASILEISTSGHNVLAKIPADQSHSIAFAP